MIELIAIGVFVSLTLITLGAVAFSNLAQATPQQRLRSLAVGAATAGANVEADDESNPFRMPSELVEKVGFWAQGTFKTDDNKKDKQDLATTLAHAGFRSQRAAPLYLGSRLLLRRS